MKKDIQQKFRGLGVALITPFKTDGQIDFPRLSELVNRVVEEGVDYLLALGTTSEYPTLAPPEKDDVLSCILEANAKRLPVMVGLGGPNTQFMIRKLEHLAQFDVDAILTVTPYYNKPSQAGLVAHYKAFTAATDMPVFLYNVPGRTSCNLEVATTLQIAEECPNVVGIKEASGYMKQILQLICKRPDNFLVISGDDLLTLPLMAAGADGLISVMANAYPGKVAQMVHHVMDQQLDDARRIHQQLVPLTIDCFKEGSPAGVKAIMAAQHVVENVLRLPLVPVSEKLQKEIELLVASQLL
ncbi:MAG: 4-hydroxy-tetrahydrodipicolinate synthase [Bacteroidales bacterium]|nr:4-hydroxy-tetrahydrodipicolinate synthase [Bacteroidales bacterium]